MIVHNHLIIVAQTRRAKEDISCENICTFLSELVDLIKMNKIFEPIAVDGKFGFTGIVGIVTSHIAFHYYDFDQTLHFDVYSCEEYDIDTVLEFVDLYWKIKTAELVFIKRDKGPEITQYIYDGNVLLKR